MTQHNNEDFHLCDCSKDKWVKFGFIILAVFLGCFLATYYIMDQMRHSFYYVSPAQMHDINRVIDEQDKVFNEFDGAPVKLHKIIADMDPVTLETIKDKSAYKMVIDLKPFGNNSKNVEVNYKSDRVCVKGGNLQDKRNSEKLYTFSQTFVLPEKINVNKVTKEKMKNKLVYTLPMIEDED